MARHGLSSAAGAAGGKGGCGGCLPLPIMVAAAVLAVVDAAIAAVAFVQLVRIQRHNRQLGWTRQMIFHFMIGLCNIVFLAYFMSTIVATCEGWLCWVHGCGFALMAGPQILFLSAFLLLLSFWVDLCHQTNDEDEDVRSYHEALLDRKKTKPGVPPGDGHRNCCPGIHVGSRQKFVILVIVLAFVIMFTFAILILVGRGVNPIDSSLLKKVYLDVFSVVILLVGGALACYGALLFSKMSKVRSETVSTEKWKVASLAAVSLICFSSSAILALVTNVPVLSSWYSMREGIITSAVLLFVYYFIGSSVPSGFVLWVMREMPPRPTVDRPAQSRVVTLFRDTPSTTQNPQWRTAVTSSNKALKSSPI